MHWHRVGRLRVSNTLTTLFSRRIFVWLRLLRVVLKVTDFMRGYPYLREGK